MHWRNDDNKVMTTHLPITQKFLRLIGRRGSELSTGTPAPVERSDQAAAPSEAARCRGNNILRNGSVLLLIVIIALLFDTSLTSGNGFLGAFWVLTTLRRRALFGMNF